MHAYLDEHLVDDFDLEIELERKELAELLDRAMSLLPPATSRLLIEKYIHGTSTAEIATRFAISCTDLHSGSYLLCAHLQADRDSLSVAHELTTTW